MLPLDAEISVGSIECNGDLVEVGTPGMICEINFKYPNDFDPQFIRQGAVLCDKYFPAHLAKKFLAKVHIYDAEVPITKGRQITVHTMSTNMAGEICALNSIIDLKTDTIKKNKPKLLRSGDIAIITVKLE